MISSKISKFSAGVLVLGALPLLFASDTILPYLVTDFPDSASWVGELIAAGWLGVASLNWLSRGAVLGGIYGRPIVFANTTLYFITALVLLRVAAVRGALDLLWIPGLAATVLAIIYAWLLLRAPIDRDASR